MALDGPAFPPLADTCVPRCLATFGFCVLRSFFLCQDLLLAPRVCQALWKHTFHRSAPVGSAGRRTGHFWERRAVREEEAPELSGHPPGGVRSGGVPDVRARVNGLGQAEAREGVLGRESYQVYAPRH